MKGRESLKTYGDRPFAVWVYLLEGRVFCQWAVNGRRKTKSWPDSPEARKEAKAWAEDFAAERRHQGQSANPPRLALTLGALWTKYCEANAYAWRPKTRRDYEQYWAALEDRLGASTLLDALTPDDVDTYRRTRRREGIYHSQVRRQIGFLRQMLNWAEGRRLVALNALRGYRYAVPKDEREKPPAEYTRKQVLAIAAELATARHWRARVAIALCGDLGARVNSVLHLQWSDIDPQAGQVTWRAQWDKGGEERIQPLTPRANAALVEAARYKHASEPWIFWALRARGKPYHYNSLHYHLCQAEKRAKVVHLRNRAFHGLRRMVIGDIPDLRDAGAWVGQKSLETTARYVRSRPEQIERARERIAGLEGT